MATATVEVRKQEILYNISEWLDVVAASNWKHTQRMEPPESRARRPRPSLQKNDDTHLMSEQKGADEDEDKMCEIEVDA